MTAGNTSDSDKNDDQSGKSAKSWSPTEIAAQQDEVLDRLDQLNSDILSLLEDVSSRLKSGKPGQQETRGDQQAA